MSSNLNTSHSTTSSLALLSVAAGMMYLATKPSLLGGILAPLGINKTLGSLVASLSALALTYFLASTRFQKQLKFMYSCFFKPIGPTNNQQDRLESFYKDQATVYDDTRHQLLRGRVTMLKLSAAKLNAIKSDSKPIWIDLGGGTGWNIERMNEFFPIENFQSVYLVDLTPSLCKVAEDRFKRKGWKNVHVINADATSFQIPQIANPEGKIDLVTMSYSLSMIDNFFPVVDKVKTLLSETGFYAVADFGTSGRTLPDAAKDGGIINRKCNWFTRWVYQIWFDFDHINLHQCRRDYLEYKFSTIKSFSGRNHFIVPYLIQIPYYVWMGCNQSSESESTSSDLVIVSTKPAFTPTRLAYDPTLKCHTQFDTYIYAFTWEDPREDLKVLDLNKDDEMFVITSAGDNALDYLCHADIKRIHCIDMNPHQNHLLELKLAALKNLDHADFWKMFGEGKHPDFAEILDLKLSPYLSSHAYSYWKLNTRRFTHDNFFKSGCSGYALTLVQIVCKVTGLDNHVDALCNATSIEEQKRIWYNNIRPVLLNSWFVRLLSNPAFLWTALGVPINQWNMLLAEGTTFDYLKDTLDPIFNRSLFSNDQYFYHLCVALKYTPQSCPSYVNPKYFDRLQNSGILDVVRMHTSSIIDVLKSLEPESLTKVILMDHMDWFSEQDARDEISTVARTTKKGGYVFWRSSARFPWYNRLFEEYGFKVEPMGVREPGSDIALDRVNMYASFYRAIKN